MWSRFNCQSTVLTLKLVSCMFDQIPLVESMDGLQNQNQMYVTRWITNMYKTTHFCIEVNNQVVNLQCVNFQLLQMWTKFQFQFLQQWIKLSNLNKLITILALGNLRCKISLFPDAVFQNCPWHIYSSSISSKKNQKKHTHTETLASFAANSR